MINKNKYLKTFLASLFLIFLLFSFPVYAADKFPAPTSYKYVNDYIGLLNKSEIESIVSIGKELEDKTGAQATIVIIDSTNNTPIEDYSNKLFREWGIGQKGKDNGLLILLALNDKKWRVEVGRGLEGAIPDALSNRVMESIAKPNFINGNYAEGLLNSYSTYSDSIATEYGVTLDKSLHISLPNDNNSTYSEGSSLLTFIGIGAFVLLFLLDIIFNGGRVSSTLIQIIFISNLGRRNGPRGGGGSSGGGGFGGFGGGSSNGGGSSGGW